MSEPAIVALTPRGIDLGRRLLQVLGRGEVLTAHDSVRQTLHEAFAARRPLICIMALGIVVRLLGPLARDKETDPPVVAVDEAGRFAISVLGGHAAGANRLAQEVAEAIDAVPVITTGSAVLGLPALDLIGCDWGWRIEYTENLTLVEAAVVRGETIGVYQDVGRRNWWKPFGDWPGSFQKIDLWPPHGYWTGLLAISDRALHDLDRWPVIVYRPPSLVLGVGCRRGAACAAIESLFMRLCFLEDLSPLSLGLVATADIKAGEAGLRQFVKRHGVPLRSFSLEELGSVSDLPTPSEKVRAKIGVAGVAEPAAMLAAETNDLIVPKQRNARITMAFARREQA